MSAEPITDKQGTEIQVGAIVQDGGRVAKIRTTDDNEGNAPTVGIEWEPDTEPEFFLTGPRNYRQEGPSGPYVWVCDDVEVMTP